MFGEPITFDTTFVPVSEGVAKLPGRYAHDFASIPLDWRIVETRSKYVVYPSLRPGSIPPGYMTGMRYWGGEYHDDRLELEGDLAVYGGGPWRRRPRWRRALDTARVRLAHAIAALRGSSSECDDY